MVRADTACRIGLVLPSIERGGTRTPLLRTRPCYYRVLTSLWVLPEAGASPIWPIVHRERRALPVSI